MPGVTPALSGANAKEIYLANPHEQIPDTERYPLEDHVDALIGTVSWRTSCSWIAVRSSRRSSVHRPFTVRSPPGEMAWSTMCKNWLKR